MVGAGQKTARLPADSSAASLDLTPASPGQGTLARAWRAVSFQEGVRAALAIAVVLTLGEALHFPPLLQASVGALFVCMGDIGGPIRARVPALASLAVLGGIVSALFGILRGISPSLSVAAVCIAIFFFSFARVYGPRKMAIGNLLIVVAVLALDRPLTPLQGLWAGLEFTAGAAWALLLTMVIWRVHPYRPAREAVGTVYRTLGEEADALRRVLTTVAAGGDVLPAEWDAHSARHRRSVREALEEARSVLLQTVGARTIASQRVSRLLIRLEDADQIFGAVIAFSQLLEVEPDRALHGRAAHLLRRIAPMLRVLAQAAEKDLPRPVPRVMRALDGLQDEAGEFPVQYRTVLLLMVDRLRIAATLVAPEGFVAETGTPDVPWRERVLEPFFANLTLHSAVLRHAVRGALVAAPALAVGIAVASPYAHWFSITLILTMQPFFALTWQRAAQRIGGTVAGAVLGGVLAATLHSPLALGIALFPLCIVTLAVRSVSFSLFMACITPLVVLLTELSMPGAQGAWDVLWLRTGFSLAGGLLAVIGALVIWPSWEPRRLSAEIAGALRAHALLLEAVLHPGAARARIEQARRAAGRASNNLEASLARAAREPAHVRPAGLDAAMAIDAALRRLGGHLTVLALGGAGADQPAEAWRDHLADRLRQLAADPQAPEPGRPAMPCPVGLQRLDRQASLMAGAMRRLAELGSFHADHSIDHGPG